MMSQWVRVSLAVLSLCACGPALSLESEAEAPPRRAAATRTAEAPTRVALTFDDLPAHGPQRSGEGVLQIHQRIITTLAQHGVSGVYGFVNGDKLETFAQGRQVLQQWRAAGHQLGNHTWSHADVGEVGAAAFAVEVDRNDAVLSEFVGDAAAARRARRLFRYPYLRQGRDLETLDAVRAHLSDGGYQIAEVTIDFGDWAYNAPFVRCSEQGSQDALSALRQDFLGRSVQALKWSKAAAAQMYGRQISHVLLLHSGSFDAEMLDSLMTAYEEDGVQWVTLAEALKDDVYAQDLRVPRRRGGTLLEQHIERDGAAHPPFPRQPLELLEQLCRPLK